MTMGNHRHFIGAVLKSLGMEELETLQSHLDILTEYGIELNDIVNPQRQSWNAGDILCDDGEVPDALYFLISGTVRTLIPIEGKQGLVLGGYANRGVFDETVLFREDNRAHIRAVCETDVEVIALPLPINKPILLKQNSFLMKEAQSLSLFMDQAMNSFYFQKYPFEYMLCSYIAVKRTDAEWVCNIEETAKDLEVTPRFVERCLELLVNKGILKEGEKGYVIEDVLRFESYNKGLYKPRRKRIKLDAGKSKTAG